tara:strand:- start:300 stop:596 length:297 start_codon:yes stop_codon:yes gene_type:complete
MEESAQWGLALLVGIPIAIFLAWFNKSGSDFKDGFQKKNKEAKKEKWQTDYYAQDPEYMKRLEEERTKPQKPEVFRGKRGGKYTKGKTKEGGSYRRYL